MTGWLHDFWAGLKRALMGHGFRDAATTYRQWRACRRLDKTFVGDIHRSWNNPWSMLEREEMVRAYLEGRCRPLPRLDDRP